MGLLEKKQAIKHKLLKDSYNNDYTNPAYIRTCMLIEKMDEANIPNGYWFYKMDNFYGSIHLKKVVDEYLNNIQQNYLDGLSICLSGSQGTGKTMSSVCILKKALKKNYSAFYITASDMFSDLTDSGTSNETKKKLKNVDFLVIDELDSRFFPSNNAKELFSSIYENIFRFRTHNGMPTIICTNETSGLSDVFYGMCKKSIDSLNAQYLKFYPVAGKDVRYGKQDESKG